MRIPNAPAPVLSPSGRLAAVVEADQLALIVTRSGQRRDIALPATSGGVAFASDDTHVAVAAGARAAILRADVTEWPAQSVALHGSLFRWVLGRTTLVAIMRSGTRATQLCAWQLEAGALTPIGPPEGLALGTLAVYHMALDEVRGRVLIGGITGSGAYSGDGKPFTGIVGLTPDLPVLWKGEGLPFQPHGYLYPLHGGGLAVTQRDRLARLALNALPEAQVVDDHAFATPLERVALSPDGRMMAWMWAGDGDAMFLRAADVISETPIVGVSFALEGNFPALAVDDDGIATVVAGARPINCALSSPHLVARCRRAASRPAEPDA